MSPRATNALGPVAVATVCGRFAEANLRRRVLFGERRRRKTFAILLPLLQSTFTLRSGRSFFCVFACGFLEKVGKCSVCVVDRSFSKRFRQTLRRWSLVFSACERVEAAQRPRVYIARVRPVLMHFAARFVFLFHFWCHVLLVSSVGCERMHVVEVSAQAKVGDFEVLQRFGKQHVIGRDVAVQQLKECHFLVSKSSIAPCSHAGKPVHTSPAASRTELARRCIRRRMCAKYYVLARSSRSLKRFDLQVRICISSLT